MGLFGNGAQTLTVSAIQMSALVEGVVVTAVFGLVGMAMLILGFKVFDWLMPKVDVEKELAERNVAVAIVMAAAILGVSGVIVAAIMG